MTQDQFRKLVYALMAKAYKTLPPYRVFEVLTSMRHMAELNMDIEYIKKSPEGQEE